jgi:carboxyl-terminal processing protease
MSIFDNYSKRLLMNTKYIALVFFLFFTLIANGQKDNATTKKLNKTVDLIDGQYFKKVDMPSIVTEAVKAMIKELDPHSKYLTKDQLQKNNEALYGNFGGIGIHYQILFDTLMVLSTTPEGPCEQAGVLPGDKLIAIDGEAAAGKAIASHTNYSKLLRGPKGSRVELQFKRKEVDSLLVFEIIRGPIPIETIDAAFMLSKDVGYIKINGFSFSTEREFSNHVNILKSEGMKHLMVDLRGNPGGLMIASIRLADKFLKAGELIVYTEGEHYKRDNYNSKLDGDLMKGRLIVLVDEYSASASEIFAGAIQDLDRGIIAGRRSYGKGLVGRNFTLPDGSAIRLTTGHYYTPSGRCIQKSLNKNKKDYLNEIKERQQHGEMLHPDSIVFPDSLKYKTRNGRIIYGGGGIMPDIFIPKDTTALPHYYRIFQQKGIINAYAGAYFDKHLVELKKSYSDLKAYKSNFKPDEAWKQLLSFAATYYNVHLNDDINPQDYSSIMKQFKYYLGRILFPKGAYYELKWEEDEMIPQCLQVIQRKKEFTNRGISNN